MDYLNEYQHGTLATWGGESRLERSILGLAGEAGEVAECRKKYLRGDYDKREYKKRVKKELGDVLYYVSVCAYEHDMMLSDIATSNFLKLQKRVSDNTIKGDGSDR